MVNVFGTSTRTGGQGPPGPPGPPGDGGIKDFIGWFPDLAIDQIRRNSNSLTLLIETIPPARDSDVEATVDKTVSKWKAFNDRDKIILTPVNNERGTKFKKVYPPPHKRYGLTFDKKEENMYGLNNKFFLSVKYGKVLLTMTFLVGVFDDYNDDTEEFIVSDYRYSQQAKSADAFRGVSVISKPDEKFDLLLHGARNDDGSKNCLKIGDSLENDLFYTLQVFWDGEGMNGFYLLYRDGRPLIDRKTFQFDDSLPEYPVAAFYLGGFNASTNEKEEKVVKSKCFTGVLSNLEILRTDQSSIPTDLLRLIVLYQTIINEEDVVDTPAIKRKKVT